MQAIKIKEAINQLGIININFSEEESIFLMNGTDIIDLNESTFDLLKNDFIDKLNTYFNNGGSVNLIEDLLNSIALLLESLLREYHINRVKLAHLSDSDLRFIEGYKKIIHLITLKINLLEGIETELKLIAENFNFKTNSDFSLVTNNHNNISGNQSNKILNSNEDNLIRNIVNPNPQIFKDIHSFLLFEKLKNTICIKDRTYLSDYSFVFRSLHKDGYIYNGVSESVFREFINSEYEISLEKLKILDYCTTPLKEMIYNQART